MKGNYKRNVMPLMPLTPEFRNTVPPAQQRFGSGRTQGADRSRLNCQKLTEEELAADFHLIRLGRTVFRRSALDHIADIDICPLERNALFRRGALDHLR